MGGLLKVEDSESCCEELLWKISVVVLSWKFLNSSQHLILFAQSELASS